VAVSPLEKRPIGEIYAGILEHIEDQKDRWAIRRGLPASPRSDSQPALKSAKVRDDDLALEDSRRWQAFAGVDELWEPASKVFTLTARRADQAVACLAHEAAEPVELWFVEPLPTRGYARCELREHRHRRLERHVQEGIRAELPVARSSPEDSAGSN
jgi:hypothetical protein